MTLSLTQFHDAELNGIEHDRAAATVKLFFALPGGSRSSLLFRHVSGLRVVDYGTQNVVARLLTSRTSDFDNADIRRNVSWLYCTADGAQLIEENRIDDVVRAITRTDLLLFMLEPSWGAEVGIVARNVDVT